MSGTNNSNPDNNNDNSNATPAADIFFYIIVSKDDQGKLSIDDINNADSIIDNIIKPTNFITDSNSKGKFFVKVLVTKEDKSNVQDFFQVGDKYYKLALDEEVDKDNVIDNIVSSSETFAAKSKMVSGGHKQFNVHKQEVDGGQKEKHKNHNKRSYSKKNRKSRSKSDTLRNYFNYSAIETM